MSRRRCASHCKSQGVLYFLVCDQHNTFQHSMDVSPYDPIVVYGQYKYSLCEDWTHDLKMSVSHSGLPPGRSVTVSRSANWANREAFSQKSPASTKPCAQHKSHGHKQRSAWSCTLHGANSSCEEFSSPTLSLRKCVARGRANAALKRDTQLH